MAAGDFLVDTVNPRLKSYNRPLCLAVAIGGCTVAATLLLFVFMVRQCDGNRTLVVGDFEDVSIALQEGSAGQCYYYVQMLKLDDAGRLTNRKCIWTNEADDATLCDDWGGGDQRSSLDRCETDYTSANPYYESVIQIRYRECPPVLPTLGAAFGYTAFIELFFTGIIILPLLKLGTIKNGKDSSQALSVREWVTEMYGQKDAAHEAGAAVIGSA